MSNKQNTSASELDCRDAQSGLYNDKHFHHALDQELARLDRWGRPLSLALIRSTGITAKSWPFFSSILYSCLRRIDLPARLNKTDAAVILPDADEYKARRWLAELISKLEGEKSLSGITFSYGLALALPWERHVSENLLSIAANNIGQESGTCPLEAQVYAQPLNSAIAAEEKSLLFDGFKALESCNKH